MVACYISKWLKEGRTNAPTIGKADAIVEDSRVRFLTYKAVDPIIQCG